MHRSHSAPRAPSCQLGALLLALAVAVLLEGCATGHPRGSLISGVGLLSNPEHVAFTARVRELLDRAGLIERPEPEPVGQ
jgi:hypothetical protein